MRVVAITGGAGFVGRRLAASLLDDGGLSLQEVRLLDIRAPQPIPFVASSARNGRHTVGQGRLTYRPCDLTSAESVLDALDGCDTVFHLGSFGMSGSEMLNFARIRRVNLGGTEHVIHACQEHFIPRLIYCSTYNVVFGRQEIVAGHEDSVPYLEVFHDEYSRTKRIAEEKVLRANSASLATCAIRPAAIFGDGEERHLPRILSHVRAGLGLAAIGSPSTLCDWVYVDNLAHALILAGSSLTLGGSRSPAAGEAYCISDDHPINNFEFLRPLCVGLGYPHVFAFWIPMWIMFHLAWLLELLRLVLMWATGDRLTFQPILTRAEVAKVAVTHYFSMDKAKRDLGYAPIVPMQTAMERCVEFYREEFGTRASKAKETKEKRSKKAS